MGLFDKAKDMLSGHADQADAAIDKAGDAVDKTTGGKFEGQVDQAQDAAKSAVDKANGEG